MLRNRASIAESSACPHMASCEMYRLMTFAGTLETWKIRYCKADYSQCARYQTASQGRPVPVNLMPNGALLKKKL